MIHYKHYTYRVTWSKEDSEYVGLCAEFPSLSYLAEEQVDALNGIVQIVQSVIEDMLREGETVPAPLAEKNFSGKFQVRIPPEMHRLLALFSAEQGVSLNRYINMKLAIATE